MSSHEDGRNGFKKGKNGEVDDFYKKRRGLVPQNDGDTGLFSKPVGDEPKTVTISKEEFEKLINPYGRMLGISDDTMELILGGLSESNGDVIMAQVRLAYAEVCAKRGYVPRGYKG